MGKTKESLYFFKNISTNIHTLVPSNIIKWMQESLGMKSFTSVAGPHLIIVGISKTEKKNVSINSFYKYGLK